MSCAHGTRAGVRAGSTPSSPGRDRASGGARRSTGRFAATTWSPRSRRAGARRKRFERALPNDLWQIDATQVSLTDGEPVWVVDCLDDHARFLLAALAVASPTGEAAWACFIAASAAYGLPRQLLSDNGLSFTGRFFGVQVAFERKLPRSGSS